MQTWNKSRFNMAEYQRGKSAINTKDFTNNASIDFEPVYSFMDGNEDYIDTFNALKSLCPDVVSD